MQLDPPEIFERYAASIEQRVAAAGGEDAAVFWGFIERDGARRAKTCREHAAWLRANAPSLLQRR